MSRTALLLILMAMPVLTAAQGTVYRWVDKQGQTHFSQTPPPDGRFELIQPRSMGSPPPAESAAPVDATAAPPATAPPAAATPPTTADINAKFLEEAEANNKARAEAKAKDQVARAEASRKCKSARERMAFLVESTARRLATVDAGGNVERMDEGEFASRQAATQKEIDSQCR